MKKIVAASIASLILGVGLAFVAFTWLFASELFRQDDFEEARLALYEARQRAMDSYFARSNTRIGDLETYVSLAVRDLEDKTDDLRARKYSLMLGHARLAKAYLEAGNKERGENQARLAIELSSDAMPSAFSNSASLFDFLKSVDEKN